METSQETTILEKIMAHKRQEIATLRQTVPLESIKVSRCESKFVSDLQGSGVKLIAEIKPKSPSAGQLATELNLAEVLSAYNKYAAAISVLADKQFFGGSMQLVADVAQQSSKPVLCKEFVFDTYQVHQARHAGAQAVLLIVKVLGKEQLSQLQEAIRALGMTPVVEVQTEDEVQTALSCGADVVLINNRDLTTFKVDLQTTARLRPLIPESVTLISASGVESRADVEKLLPYTNKFLVGSSLMRSGQIEEKLRELCGNC